MQWIHSQGQNKISTLQGTANCEPIESCVDDAGNREIEDATVASCVYATMMEKKPHHIVGCGLLWYLEDKYRISLPLFSEVSLLFPDKYILLLRTWHV